MNWRLTAALIWLGFAAGADFTFAIIGDRTGNAQFGVYQHTWREVDRSGAAFAINAGDSIQGGDDASAAEQWTDIEPLLKRKLPFYLVPGNHDIWSPKSEQIWRRVTGHAPDYSFTHGDAHLVVLDNSRGEALTPGQMAFLEQDLQKHASVPVKIVVFHKPFWLVPVMLRNADFPLHAMARKYGVQAIVSGHVHRFGYWKLDGVDYVLMGSSGGQLRGDRFSEGWFFHWIEAKVHGGEVTFVVHELPAPDGEGRVFPAAEWTSFR